MIRVEDFHKHFGGIRAVDGVTLEIETGSITGLIGPNGAGKTTLFNCIAGHYAPTSGHVYLDGEDISGLPPHTLFDRGLLRTFQIAHEFSTLTVRENLMMVPADQPGENLWQVWANPSRVRAVEDEIRKRADEVIEFLEIPQVADELASGQLRVLLEQFEPRPLPVHIVHREGRYSSAKVRAFIDLMADRLRSDPALN